MRLRSLLRTADTDRSTRRRRRLALVLALGVVIMAATGGWLLLRDDSATAVAPTTATVSKETVEETVAASGTVEAAAAADLAFDVSGTITAVYVEPGDTVRRGARLAAVDDAALIAARRAAVSSLVAARAQLDDDLDADASAVQIAADRAAILSARAALTEARDDVDGAVLRATIGGTVAAVEIEVGDTVGSTSTPSATGGADATGGSTSSSSTESTAAAVTVTSRRHFVVAATVSSADADRLEQGLQAEVTVTGLADPVYGTVDEVGAIAQTSSSGAAVFPVTVEITGAQSDLYAGASAEVSITVKRTEGVLTVSSRALQSDDEGTYVDRVEGDGTVRTAVEVGETYGMTTEVLSGLAEGDVVEVPSFAVPAGGGSDDEQGGFPGGGAPPDFTGELPGGSFPGGGMPQ